MGVPGNRFGKIVCALVAVAFFAAPARPRLGGGPVFELKIDGKSYDTGAILNPGVKPPIGKISTGKIADVLKGMLPDYASDFVDLDGGGKFYLYYDGKDQWRVATNPNGMDTTLLQGQVANDGTFFMAGKYTLFMANADCFVKGKVTFKKGTFEPTKIKGKFYLVSEDITTALDLNIETGKKL